jgi:outer membrane protein OmpA-like peptidoglycan-associated protein
MLNLLRYTPAMVLLGTFALTAQAQVMNPTATDRFPQGQGPSSIQNGTPIYKIQVVGRDIPAINYFHRSGSTRIGFDGTPLLPMAKGHATVQSNKGQISIDAHFEGLKPANGFGVEYLTYVLWAITPAGQAQALGEILPTGGGNKCDIKVTTNLQAFALIVTAEPYFDVSIPSDVVVLQNSVLKDRTQGIIEEVNAHATLLPRGAYATTSGANSVANPITRNDQSPLELYEAINAVQIARAAGAEQLAADTFEKAMQNLQNAQSMDAKKSERKQEITYARAAVQAAEDSRVIAIRKHREMDEAAQQQAKENAQQQAQQSEIEAQQARMQAQQPQLQAQQAAAQQATAEAQAAQAQLAAQQAQQASQKAVDQTAQMREQLRNQLNSVLNTQETARGLIVNLSDVLFDTGKYSLKPDTKIKLAKVAGILQAYPGLKVQVEGYTDNVGGQEYNQKLSESRAQTVGDFLVAQGVPLANVTATGFGLNDPTADNSTAAGRAQNRRVQLVVSGGAIGVQQQAEPNGGISAPAGQQPGQPQ